MIKIHAGNKCGECEIFYVHGEKMKEAHEFKYLRDLINENGRAKSTINQRISRGYAIVSQIFALLSVLPIMISEDFHKNGIDMTDEQIVQMQEIDYKKLIKSKVNCTAFNE